jgi:excisionase family DNA binding protein
MAIVVNKRLLGVKEAAQYLSISRSKLYQWAVKGRVRSVRIDARRLFDVTDLDELVEQLKTNNGNKGRMPLDGEDVPLHQLDATR